MSDYISREYVLKCMEDSYKNAGISAEAASKVRKWLYKAPAADVRPMVRGKWLRTQAYPHRIYCSNCYVTFIRNDEFLELKETPHNYCPNCGADMREENDD